MLNNLGIRITHGSLISVSISKYLLGTGKRHTLISVLNRSHPLMQLYWRHLAEHLVNYISTASLPMLWTTTVTADGGDDSNDSFINKVTVIMLLLVLRVMESSFL